MKIRSGVAIATTAALLFAVGVTTTTVAHAASAKVKCSGINSCKGTSECKTASNACKGQNTCKGHGWVNAKSTKECEEKGGKVIK
ncbi:MAG: hypothetical protein HY308_10990 [Gammaproteobacteria bacterium]|nr:hypothetical protein [Gammaproteobacteria bacterium]